MAIQNVVFAPKKGKAAEWQFHPNAKLRKKYPDAELDFLGMDAQEGEFLSLKVLGQSVVSGRYSNRFSWLAERV